MSETVTEEKPDERKPMVCSRILNNEGPQDFEILYWPEFQAFAEEMLIEYYPTDGYYLSINIPHNGRVMVVTSRGVTKLSFDGISVVRTPVFLSLAKRLGICLDLPFRTITITAEMNQPTVVWMSYLADDIDQQETKTPFD